MVTPKLLKGTALIKKAIGDQLEPAGQEMEATARQLAHVKTGYMRSTIYHKTDPGQLSLELGAKADYALFQEMGTRKMAANPFIRPAVDAGLANLQSLIRDGILWAFQ